MIVNNGRNYESFRNKRIMVMANIDRNLTDEEKQRVLEVAKSVDIVLSLGDISKSLIDVLNPDFGVLGNQDLRTNIDKNRNIAKRVVFHKGLIIGGYDGSNRYKAGNFVLHTQNESIQDLSNMGYCEIFITHDSPLQDKFKDSCDDLAQETHCGLYGIDDYLQTKKPLIHFYGHYHQHKEEMKYGVPSICVDGIEVIEIKPSFLKTNKYVGVSNFDYLNYDITCETIWAPKKNKVDYSVIIDEEMEKKEREKEETELQGCIKGLKILCENHSLDSKGIEDCKSISEAVAYFESLAAKVSF